MSTIGFTDLSGMIPLRNSTLLPDNYSSLSINSWLYRGLIRGLRISPPVHTLIRPATTQQIYRIPLDSFIFDWVNSFWLEFPDQYMKVIRPPVVGDSFERYYFFPSSFYVSDGSPGFNVPYYAPLANVLAGGPYYILGIPTPGVAPGVTPAGVVGSDTPEVRSYVYTYISAYGEEGPPSPATLGTGDPIAAWSITVTCPTAAQLLNRNLTAIRLYRTVTDSSGNAVFYQVTQIAITTASAVITFSDSQIDTSITGNLVLASTFYDEPPAGLEGVQMMANGIMAGFTNEQEVWFSEPFLPHAWNPNYALTVPYVIVGLNAIGTSLSILTKGQPSIATGTTPSTMTIGQVTANEPCISRGSIFAAGEGTYYASPNGLILLNTSGTINVTQFSMEREFWSAIQPEIWASGRQGLTYTAFLKGATTDTTTIIFGSVTHINGVVLDHVDKNVPCSLVQGLVAPETKVVNLYWDEISGQLMLLNNVDVRWWMPPQYYPLGNTVPYGTLLPWTWQSKKFRLHKPEQIKAFKINFDIPAEITIPPPVFPGNTVQNQVFNPATQYLIISVYADGNLIVTREVTQDNLVLLIPGGYKATYWQFLLQGQISMRLFKASGSVKDLRKA